MKLERLLSQQLQCGQKGAREHLRAGLVSVNHITERDGQRIVGRFDHVHVTESGDNTIVIQARTPRYLALHKPTGYVSATTDPDHPTVIDLIDESWSEELHLAGRLDRYTTGLVLLTNDSAFSEALTRPESKVPKVYLVGTDKPIPSEALTAFEKGMPFAKEGIHTQPAIVDTLSDNSCRLTIFEGKHHQVKRMFARFDIKVIKLHREAIGAIRLGKLPSAHHRPLTEEEVTIFADGEPT